MGNVLHRDKQPQILTTPVSQSDDGIMSRFMNMWQMYKHSPEEIKDPAKRMAKRYTGLDLAQLEKAETMLRGGGEAQESFGRRRRRISRKKIQIGKT